MRGEKILVVDDESLIRWFLVQELNKEGFTVLEAETKAQALALVCEADPDLLLLDQRLMDGTGIEILQEIQKEKNNTVTIMLTSIDKSNTAVDAMKLGAFDYITKPIDIEELKIVITKALDATRLKRQFAYFLKGQQKQTGFCGIIGSSSAMQSAMEAIKKVAQSSRTTVLITGESGTGKELAARAIHDLSDRREKPFMTVNCGAVTETLIESELFGHEKGAFTDAKMQKKGVFELADTGTIFLDEIGDISPAMQVRLLRVLEQKTFRRVGGSADISVDLRIIAATNQPLGQRVEEGKFRTDLYYRLNVAHIRMPPLRERNTDVIMLAEFFLQEFNTLLRKNFKGFSEEAKELFLHYDWPGNVRELRNVIERATLMDEGEYLFSHHVELGHLHTLSAPQSSSVEGTELSLEEIEKQTLLHALEKTDYNQSQASRLLKISRDTLRYRMKKFGLKRHGSNNAMDENNSQG